MAAIECKLSTKKNPKDGTSEVLIRFQNGRGINRRGHSRIFILPQYWDDDKKQIVIKARKLTNEVRDTNFKKVQLEKLLNHIILSSQRIDAEETKHEWLQDTIDKYLFPEEFEEVNKRAKAGFFDIFQDFLKEKDFAPQRLKHYKVLERILNRWELYKGEQLEIDNLLSVDIENLRIFIRDEYKFFYEQSDGHRKPYKKYTHLYELVPESRYPVERGDNYISSMIKMLRAFYMWCNVQEITRNDPFKKYKINSEVYGTPIYISMEERNQIAEADFSNTPQLEIQRDIFIFHCFIGCRISDLYSLTKNNLISDSRGIYIEYVPNKTKKNNPNVVRVYLAAKALDIIEKYQDYDSEKLFPLISQQKYNDAIKRVFKKAGIVRKVTVRNTITGANELKSIADVASSHMARRTFIGNLYKQVKDPNLVGKLSGHKEGSKAFSRYRDIDEDMVREMTNLLG